VFLPETFYLITTEDCIYSFHHGSVILCSMNIPRPFPLPSSLTNELREELLVPSLLAQGDATFVLCKSIQFPLLLFLNVSGSSHAIS